MLVSTEAASLRGQGRDPERRLLDAGGIGQTLVRAPTDNRDGPGAPTAMVGTPDGRWAFALLSKDASGAIAVMAVTHGTPRSLG
jgi:hypothetical protein